MWTYVYSRVFSTIPKLGQDVFHIPDISLQGQFRPNKVNFAQQNINTVSINRHERNTFRAGRHQNAGGTS